MVIPQSHQKTNTTNPNTTPPSWSFPPPPPPPNDDDTTSSSSSSSLWHVEEIKNGTIQSTHPLHQSCTLFGRAADVVQIPTSHPSCSRIHARIAFDEEGQPWFCDLGSGHGSTVNKTPFRNEEESGGGKGVMIFPGDVIRLGASRRIFCVVGPREWEREVVWERRRRRRRRAAEDEAATMTERTDLKEEEGEGVSWGIDTTDRTSDDNDDDDATDSHTLPSSTTTDDRNSLDVSRLSEKQAKTYERYMAKKYKLSNLRRESERISRKGGLSEGQSAQLEKNKKREGDLERELKDLAEVMRDAVTKKKRGGRSQSTRRREEEEEDETDYDFYDRTKTIKNKQHIDDDSQTEDSLTLQWKTLATLLSRRQLTLSSAKTRLDNLRTKLSLASEDDDDDAFFLKNDVDLATDETRKAQRAVGEVEMELDGVERLMRVVNETVVFDRAAGVLGEFGNMRDCGAVEVTTKPATTTTSAVMPAPTPQTDKQPIIAKKAVVASSTTHAMSPPPPRPPPQQQSQTSTSSHMPPPPPKSSSSSLMPPPPPKMIPSTKRQKRGPVVPTAPRHPPPGSTVSSLLRANATSSSATSSQKRSKTTTTTTTTPPTSFHSKKDEWRAPKDQDGSGMTSLNKKFAGRY